MQAIIYADTREMKRDAWLEARRGGIGGSDAAAIVGLDGYKTPFRLWAEKTGQMEPDPENERMRLGRYAEEYVAQRFTDLTGKKVRRRNAILRHPEHPFMLANVDRLVVSESAGLECKTTSVLNLRKFKGGEFPGHYYAQCMHYLAVTGLERWYLCVLVLGSPEPPMVFTIERDEDEIRALIEAEKAFWQGYILTKTPPPADGLEPTTKALGSVYEGGDDTEIYLPIEDKVASYLMLKERKKAADAALELIEQEIKLAMKDHEKAASGAYRISWKGQIKSTFDAKRYGAEFPEIDLSPYYKKTAFRKFEIKEAKN